MFGVYKHTIDAKGRLAIPSRIREELGETFYVTISSEECLTAYSAENWQKMMDKISALPRIQQNKARPLFAHAAKCELDSQGRVLLPQNLREFARLDKNVAVVGNGECAQLWDEASWDAVDTVETTAENIAQVLQELDF